jgi:hypothetical protein
LRDHRRMTQAAPLIRYRRKAPEPTLDTLTQEFQS